MGIKNYLSVVVERLDVGRQFVVRGISLSLHVAQFVCKSMEVFLHLQDPELIDFLDCSLAFERRGHSQVIGHVSQLSVV